MKNITQIFTVIFTTIPACACAEPYETTRPPTVQFNFNIFLLSLLWIFQVVCSDFVTLPLYAFLSHACHMPCLYHSTWWTTSM